MNFVMNEIELLQFERSY